MTKTLEKRMNKNRLMSQRENLKRKLLVEDLQLRAARKDLSKEVKKHNLRLGPIRHNQWQDLRRLNR